ncbi:hypothetical protein J437_LFUL012471 [Ladona fulva]|uniref:TIR domain-containing protein n=1 Tax=Ladona fulva TaxID=123851 RepID=A0A8K0P015_LADFU|nr:hypothetical protein J437_LFUL012471 [Ladona fulva]
MSGIALLVSLVGGIFYIYRFEASYVIHMMRVRSKAAKGEGKPHSECIYDAFVSYSGRDRQWVLRVLQPVLEECNQRYQLCLHDRNFPLGGIVTQNIVDSIDKSRKTLLILSKNFVESQWCCWEMEMANHKLFNDSRNFLILIELDRLDRKMLPRHLRFLMETRTYLEWPENNSISKDVLEVETSQTDTIEYQGKSAELDFWRRLQEALGDSLYVKEKKAKREAEIAIQKTKLREADVPLSAEEEYQHYKEN